MAHRSTLTVVSTASCWSSEHSTMNLPPTTLSCIAAVALSSALCSCVQPAKSTKNDPPVAAPVPVFDPLSVRITADIFPSGQSTPEGVACDLARSYITSNGELFRQCCFVITPGTPERDAYNNFLDDTVTEMDLHKSAPKSQGGWPIAILKVYQARSVSSSAAAAFGAENYRFTALDLVDIELSIRHGAAETRRTLVARDEGSGLWFAIPHPEYFPRLSVGMNEESPSTELWKPPAP
jgi:hypothetical protein